MAEQQQGLRSGSLKFFAVFAIATGAIFTFMQGGLDNEEDAA